jgi:hypothetical protein
MTAPNPILVAGAGGGSRGSTGLQVTRLLHESGHPVRALVHCSESHDWDGTLSNLN